MSDDPGPRDDVDPDAVEHTHGPEEGERPDDAVEYEPGEVGERHNEDGDAVDRQLSTDGGDDDRHERGRE